MTSLADAETESHSGRVYREGFLQCLSIVAPHLDGRDAARLRAVDQATRKAVGACVLLMRRIKQHYVRLGSVHELATLLPMDLFFWDDPGEDLTLLKENIGVEGLNLYRSHSTCELYLMSNHYEHFDFLHKDWDKLVESYDRPYMLIQYPPLRGTTRFNLETGMLDCTRHGSATIHRGGLACFSRESQTNLLYDIIGPRKRHKMEGV